MSPSLSLSRSHSFSLSLWHWSLRLAARLWAQNERKSKLRLCQVTLRPAPPPPSFSRGKGNCILQRSSKKGKGKVAEIVCGTFFLWFAWPSVKNVWHSEIHSPVCARLRVRARLSWRQINRKCHNGRRATARCPFGNYTILSRDMH